MEQQLSCCSFPFFISDLKTPASRRSWFLPAAAVFYFGASLPIKPPVHRNPYLPLPEPDHLRRGTAAARGYDSAWREFRENYLRDHPLCVFHETPNLSHRCEV